MSGEATLPPAIGRYRVVGILGTGAMGTVYKASDPKIGRMVAIKVIRTDALEQGMRDEYLERFTREVQAAGRCSHSGIVAVYDFSGDTHNPYIVMEMVEGAPLNRVMRDAALRQAVRQGDAPGPFMRSVITQLLEALGYAHRLGITHRDVKPGNILVTPEGRAKIVDFGIARLAGGSITQTGSMLGTPSYMSPEQATEADVDYRADLFAVGAILYEAVTGKPPFAGRNLSDTILRLSLPDPAAMDPILAADAAHLVPILRRALAKRREERYQSAEEFAAALNAPTHPATGAVMPARSDETVVMTTVPPPFQPPAAPDPGSLGGSLMEGRWDPALLRKIERALAGHVGPMARVMLRDAARTSNTADELVQALARVLANASDRSQFLRAIGPETGTVSRGPSGATLSGQSHASRFDPLGPPTGTGAPTSPPTGTIPHGTLAPGKPFAVSPAVLEAAQAALVVFVGPMARVLARKAAGEATSPQDFTERLCAHVAKAADNAALRRKLQTEVEPKLR